MKHRLYFFIFCLFFGALFFVIIADALEYNAFNGNVRTNRYVFTYFPQGWAFFTRNPRESQIQLFKEHNGKLLKLNHFHSHSTNIFGTQRNVTRFSYELSAVYNQLPKEKFMDCESNIQLSEVYCFPPVAQSVENKFDNPTLCGTYLLVIQELVPWAWSKNITQEKMPAKVMAINVLCRK